MNSDGTLRRVDELIPFSVGKRFCAGESMARTELFLIFVNLFNLYEANPIFLNSSKTHFNFIFVDFCPQIFPNAIKTAKFWAQCCSVAVQMPDQKKEGRLINNNEITRKTLKFVNKTKAI
jgi:hypothetical protein